jgi:hypothetical protein
MDGWIPPVKRTHNGHSSGIRRKRARESKRHGAQCRQHIIPQYRTLRAECRSLRMASGVFRARQSQGALGGAGRGWRMSVTCQASNQFGVDLQVSGYVNRTEVSPPIHTPAHWIVCAGLRGRPRFWRNIGTNLQLASRTAFIGPFVAAEDDAQAGKRVSFSAFASPPSDPQYRTCRRKRHPTHPGQSDLHALV